MFSELLSFMGAPDGLYPGLRLLARFRILIGAAVALSTGSQLPLPLLDSFWRSGRLTFPSLEPLGASLHFWRKSEKSARTLALALTALVVGGSSLGAIGSTASDFFSEEPPALASRLSCCSEESSSSSPKQIASATGSACCFFASRTDVSDQPASCSYSNFFFRGEDSARCFFSITGLFCFSTAAAASSSSRKRVWQRDKIDSCCKDGKDAAESNFSLGNFGGVEGPEKASSSESASLSAAPGRPLLLNAPKL